MLDARQLDALAAVIEHGSFSAAAKALSLTLAAVSAGDRGRAEAAMAALRTPVSILDTAELVAASDVIVDSAPTG